LWRLQFLGYLRTLSLQFQKARTKIKLSWLCPLGCLSQYLDTKLGETPRIHTNYFLISDHSYKVETWFKKALFKKESRFKRFLLQPLF
jgi:hypothetical protein